MLSIVVPVYNGAGRFEELARRLESSAAAADPDYEIIFVDDGSSDRSPEKIRSYAGVNSRAGWVTLARNYGQQTAVLCGLRHSRGDWVVMIDDDLEHPPEMIPVMFAKIKTGHDAVYAVAPRNNGPDSGRLRSIGADLRDLFFSAFLGKPRGLKIGSFRIFSRAAVDAICRAKQPFVYISAELFRRGFSAVSMEYGSASASTSGRYSPASRIRLFLKLTLWYKPVLGSIVRAAAALNKKTVQYSVAGKGGCL